MSKAEKDEFPNVIFWNADNNVFFYITRQTISLISDKMAFDP